MEEGAGEEAVNTFVPFPDPANSAAVLDRARLGKQRVEALTLLRVLSGTQTGWRNHPATKMWAGHEGALAAYGLAICAEWVRRGYRDSCAEKIRDLADPDENWPGWWGDEAVHRSHRSNLRRKDEAHYGKLWPDVPPDLPYVWPRPERTLEKKP